MQQRLTFGIAGFLLFFSISAFSQVVPCFPAINVTPSGQPFSFSASGGSNSFLLNVGANNAGLSCHWTLTSPGWIHPSPTFGGGGSVSQFSINFSVDPNPDLAPRTGFIIATQTEDGSKAQEQVNEMAATGSFSIAVTPGSQTTVPGGSTSFSLLINRTGQFTGCVAFRTTGPSGIGAGVFSPNPACATTATLTIPVNTTACPGSYTVFINGTNGNVTQSPTVILNVVGDFSLAVTPGVSLVQGTNNSSAVVTIDRQPSGQQLVYSNSISLSDSGLPTGATLTFNPNNTTGNTSTLTITAGATTPLGTYPITINGSGGCLSRSTNFNLTVSPSWWPAIQQILN